ncbi:DUF2716 domain-containing protein [Peterkaempfera bronchialis]|uniref:DUF2716 domain-containing protein n=1 Tax=Peterkaempfera bronchialis TaxID=2126346 RepID=UPI003C2C7370
MTVRPLRIPAPLARSGDYHIYLAEDFSFGSFGNPWEQKVCAFGRELLRQITPGLDEILGPAVRRDGSATGAPWLSRWLDR